MAENKPRSELSKLSRPSGRETPPADGGQFESLLRGKPTINISQRKILVSDESTDTDKKSASSPKAKTADKTTLLPPDGTSKLEPVKSTATVKAQKPEAPTPSRPAASSESITTEKATPPEPGKAIDTDVDIEALRHKYQIPTHKLAHHQSPVKKVITWLILIGLIVATGAYIWLQPEAFESLIDKLQDLF